MAKVLERRKTAHDSGQRRETAEPVAVEAEPPGETEHAEHEEHQEHEEHDREIYERYQEECDRWPDRKVEIVNGRIVVTEMATINHARIIFRLLRQLLSVAAERDWEVLSGVKIFFGAQKDRYVPDLIVLPGEPETWDQDNVYADEALLVVEVVSPSSVHDDHVIKPRTCAEANVPLYMVVDTFEGEVRLLSRPGEQGYGCTVSVVIGEPLELPEPWSITVDTGQLKR
ncbi:hypothetical protein Misp01_12520 [Microtetraspora sp. NBRC 13810]|uniref:Uma2 family endonuclease n=1 Tax=Microtetraspora sp. NBRC 13810 TaxID=3030990 RepID=UPI0024A507AF|nr:Uma2 family endonuclease [Microtetraspora sp. NBRC 13810]GLW06122.1 hypothetical protein Misp01_12520 [Microtetraspora sp. NBRC 13810]